MTTREKGIELLRWLAVVPAAALGNFVGYYLGGALGLLAQTVGLVNPPSDDTSTNRLFRYLIWLFPVGVAVVVAGATMAPRWHRATASILAVLWILWTDRIHGFEGPTMIATLLSAGCGFAFVVYSESKRGRRSP